MRRSGTPEPRHAVRRPDRTPRPRPRLRKPRLPARCRRRGSAATTTAGAGSPVSFGSATGGAGGCCSRAATELFFLDEATAFAAGHRPCALCRRADYNRVLDICARTGGARAGADEVDAGCTPSASTRPPAPSATTPAGSASSPTARSCLPTGRRGSSWAAGCCGGPRRLCAATAAARRGRGGDHAPVTDRGSAHGLGTAGSAAAPVRAQ